ncbi:flippase-like domain-containing protein [Streptomyces javensis]|uniref:Flippase-like domain-containing protein n=2 Tax=Streptomyces javensis TaxID=114698 RepID=A0ABS0RKD0_9ACTN|nr:flippase-like domain-containing protein [Streptomyces javensis]
MTGALRARLGAAAGVAILGVVLWRLGTGAFVDGLRTVDGLTLLAAVGLGLLTTVFSAWRWCLVARGLRIRLPLGPAVADYYRALFLNAALPGGVLGDVHRAVRHGRDAGDVGRGVRAVVLERVAGQVVLIAVGVAILLARPSPALEHAGRLIGGPAAAWALAAGCVLALLAVAAVRRRRAAPVAGRRRGAVRGALLEARRGLLARGSWPGVVISSVVVLAGHLTTFVLAARVAGSDAPLTELVPLMVLALIAMALPLNVGGWGPREGVTAWAFGAAGLGASQGLTVAVVYGVLTFAASLPGAVVLAVQGYGRLRGRQVEFEEGVLAEGVAADRRAERVPHDGRPVEAQPGYAVAEQDRGHGDVEPVQRPRVQEARHGDPAALDEYPAEPAPPKRPHQVVGGEGVRVVERQHVHAVRRRRPALTGGAHHPQGRS